MAKSDASTHEQATLQPGKTVTRRDINKSGTTSADCSSPDVVIISSAFARESEVLSSTELSDSAL